MGSSLPQCSVIIARDAKLCCHTLRTSELHGAGSRSVTEKQKACTPKIYYLPVPFRRAIAARRYTVR